MIKTFGFDEYEDCGMETCPSIDLETPTPEALGLARARIYSGDSPNPDLILSLRAVVERVWTESLVRLGLSAERGHRLQVSIRVDCYSDENGPDEEFISLTIAAESVRGPQSGLQAVFEDEEFSRVLMANLLQATTIHLGGEALGAGVRPKEGNWDVGEG